MKFPDPITDIQPLLEIPVIVLCGEQIQRGLSGHAEDVAVRTPVEALNQNIFVNLKASMLKSILLKESNHLIHHVCW